MQKYLIAFIFIFYSTISYACASIISSAFSVVYFASILSVWIFIVKIMLEAIALYYLQINITVKRAISIAFIGNVISTIMGTFITSFFPSGFEDIDTYTFYALLGIPIAYILSILIEYIVLRLIKNIDKPFLCSLLMNSTSYSFIVAFLYYLYF